MTAASPPRLLTALPQVYAAAAVRLALPLLVLPLVATRLGADEFGRLGFILVWAGLLALTVAAWFRDRPAFAALAAAALALATMPAVYVVLNYVASHQFFTPWFRYGFSMMPFAFAAAAAGFRRRAGGLFFAGLGGIAMISALVAL